MLVVIKTFSRWLLKLILFQPVSCGFHPVPQYFFELGLPALLRFDLPEDGLPTIQDWVQTCTSMLMDGIELQREPLSVCVPDMGFLDAIGLGRGWDGLGTVEEGG